MSERDLIDNDLIESLNGEIVAMMWKSPLGADRVALQGQYEPLTKDPIPLWPLSSVTQLVATIASLSEALAEAEKKGAEDWQPIETAPRDGTQILVYVPSGRREKDRVQAGSCARNLNKQDIWIIGNQFGFDVGEPTHWRPLPAPPRDLSQGGQHG